MQLSPEIFSARTLGDTILIGPRSSFGRGHRFALQSEDAVRRRLTEARLDPGALDRLRRAFERWRAGERIARLGPVALIARIAADTRRGRLAVFLVPNGELRYWRRPDVAEAAAKLAAAGTRGASGATAAVRSAIPATGPAPLPGSAPPARMDVGSMRIEERFLAILERTATSERLGPEAAAQLKALTEPAQVATTVAVLVAWAASHAFGIGFVFDGVMLGLGAVLVGRAVVDAARNLNKFLEVALRARTETQLDEAADLLAAVIVALGIRVIEAALRRGVGRVQSGGPKRDAGRFDRKVQDHTPPPPKKQLLLGPGPSSDGKLLPASEADRRGSPGGAPPDDRPGPDTKPAPPSSPPKIDPSRYDRPDAASMNNDDARRWYHAQEDRIPDIIDKSAPLETQAKQAHAFRNEIRTAARDAMKDRDTAERLHREAPNISWEELIAKKRKEGYEGDALWKAVIESSQKSRPGVDAALGIKRKK